MLILEKNNALRKAFCSVRGIFRFFRFQQKIRDFYLVALRNLESPLDFFSVHFDKSLAQRFVEGRKFFLRKKILENPVCSPSIIIFSRMKSREVHAKIVAQI